MRGVLRAAAAVCGMAMALALPAKASVWNLAYASNGGAPSTAHLTLTVRDTANSAGSFDVLGVAGDVDGDLVTGLVPNPNTPNPVYSADGLFIIDNNFQLSLPNISWYGLLFKSANYEYNLFSDNPTQYELYKANEHGYVANSVGGVTLSEAGTRALALTDGVPEPAAWALLITGFAAMGGALRASRRRASAAAG